MFRFDRLGRFSKEVASVLTQGVLLPLHGLGRSAPRRRPVAGLNAPNVKGHVVLTTSSTLSDETVVEVIHLAGGRNVRVEVLTVGAADPVRSYEEVARCFHRFGMDLVRRMDFASRADAFDADRARRLQSARVLALCSADRERVLEVLSGTPSAASVARAHAAGATVVGLGPSAAALGEGVAVRAAREGPADHDGGGADDGETVVVVEGLGLVRGVIVDLPAEPGPPGRLPREVMASLRRGLLWVGLERGASAVVAACGDLKVLGEGSVTVLDGTGVPARPAGSGIDAFAFTDVTVHVLADGYGFDLALRRPLRAARDRGAAGAGAGRAR